jgi:calcineurin-like phosphoesterase family protein
VSGNIHGHLHKYRVKKTLMKLEYGAPVFEDAIDERYYSVCVEQHNYTPVEFEDIRKHYRLIGNTTE